MNATNIPVLIQTIEHRLAPALPDPTLCSQYAWWIVEAISGYNKTILLTTPVTLSSPQLAQIEEWLHALIEQKKPIQYLLGKIPFNAVEIVVQPPLLIPRPETEEWCAQLIKQLKPFKDLPLIILDLCCGSGCIAIALAKALPQATVYATDVDGAAITLTQQNAVHNNVNNIVCLQSDLFNNLPAHVRFDLIVSNPPYIAPHELEHLDESVKNWEALHALVADDNGLAIIKKIIVQAPNYVKPNKDLQSHAIAQLILEIGYQQGPAVVDLLTKAHYNTIQVHKDLEGKNRTVRARIINV